MENEPKTSSRHLSKQMNLSVKTCSTILKKIYIYVLKGFSFVTQKCWKCNKKRMRICHDMKNVGEDFQHLFQD
jgi:hypothetical protein